MAENKDIGFKLEINGVEKSISSIKDLKGAIKDLQDVAENSDIGSEQYKQAIEDLEKLNDQLKEVTQTEKQAAKAAEDLAKAEKEAAKETGDLRKQFESLEDQLFMLAGQGKENTEEFRELAAEASKLNRRIDDVNQSLSGSGAERAESGFSKLGESLKKLDFKGVAQGAKLMGTALAATGVMLIVQLVSYLIANFDELSKGSGGLAKALKFVGDVIGEILKAGEQMLNFLTDAIGLTSELERTQEAMGKKAIDSFTKSKEALGEQTAEMDRNIKVAKAMGKNTVEMEIEKQKAIIATNLQYLLQLQQMSKTRAITEEEMKLVKESSKAIKDAKAEIQIIEANANKEKEATIKTNTATAEANRQKQLADEKKLLDDIQKERLASMKDRDAAAYMQLELDKKRAIEEINATKASDEIKEQARFSIKQDYIAKVEALDKQIADKKSAEEDKLKADEEAKRLADLEKEKKFQDELLAIAKAKKLKEIEDEKKKQAEIFELTNTSLSATQNLSDLFFTLKTSNLKKGSKEEEEYAKKQFEINKGLQIATALVNGAQGVLAITTVPDFTLGVATAIRIAGQVALTAATVAKIATTKFQPTSSGGGGDTGGGIPSVPIPPPPTVNTPGANVEGTRFDQEGNKINNQQAPMIQVNATVGVDEITAKSNRVQVLENQSKF